VGLLTLLEFHDKRYLTMVLILLSSGFVLQRILLLLE
jgi:hypothetical protein